MKTKNRIQKEKQNYPIKYHMSRDKKQMSRQLEKERQHYCRIILTYRNMFSTINFTRIWNSHVRLQNYFHQIMGLLKSKPGRHTRK